MSFSTKTILIDVGIAVLLFVVSFGLSVGIAAAVLIRMPTDYFQNEDAKVTFFADRPGWQRKAAMVGKNVLGVLLVIVGVIMSLPGVPGQGILTILIGLMLLDFKSKRRFEKRLMKIPAVLRGANTIRARFGKPPFAMEGAPVPA